MFLRQFYQAAVRLSPYRSSLLTNTKMGNTKSFTVNKSPSGSGKTSKAGTPEPKIMSSSDDYIEGVVCHESEMKENEMKAFDLGGTKILLVRQGGCFSAIGNKCSHYGAPLHTGALGVGRVRCPWHGACFNTKTGDIEDFPGLDSVPCYQVNVMPDGNVKVRASKADLEANRRVKGSMKDCPSDSSMFVVVGGGPSAAACVETLRQNGCPGRVVMIAKENALPYDRIKISKGLDLTADKLQFRSNEYYTKNNIEVHKGVAAINVNTRSNTVTLSSGETLNYASLFLATGSKSRKLTVPGGNLKNVFTLRDVSDGAAIFAQLGPDKNVVVLGVSFIGMEAAAYCVNKVKTVTIIGRGEVPFQSVFGTEVGGSIMRLFESQSSCVQFKMNNNIKSCIGENGIIKSVELTDGTTIPADVLIVGLGSTFNTEFLKDSGIDLEPNGSVTVDDKLETNVCGVFAGGDIAYAPVYSHGGVRASIGHIGLAHQHGRTAALNMLGNYTPLKATPFFWTLLFGKSIRYCGHGKFTSLKIEGDVNALKFVAFYFDDAGKVIAMASCQKDPIVSQFAELLAQGKCLHADELRHDPFAWTKSYLD